MRLRHDRRLPDRRSHRDLPPDEAVQRVVGGQRRGGAGRQRRGVGVGGVAGGEQCVRLLGSREVVREPGEVVPVVPWRIETEGLHWGDRVSGGVGQLQRRHGRQARLVGRRLVADRRARARRRTDRRDQRLRGSAHRGVAEAGPVPDRIGRALDTLGRADRDRGGRHDTVGALRRDDLDLPRRRVVERRGQPERVDDRRRLPYVVGPGTPRDVGPVPEPVGASRQVAIRVEVVGATVVVDQLVGVRHLTSARPPRQDAGRARERQVAELVVHQPAGLGRIEEVRPARGRVDPLEAGDVDERAADAPSRPPARPVDRGRGPLLLPVELDRHVGGSVAVHGDEWHRDRELASALVDVTAETTVEGEPTTGGGWCRLRRHTCRRERHRRHRPLCRPQGSGEYGECDHSGHRCPETRRTENVETSHVAGVLSSCGPGPGALCRSGRRVHWLPVSLGFEPAGSGRSPVSHPR